MPDDQPPGMQDLRAYAGRAYKPDVMKDFELLLAYCPDVATRWMEFRQAVFPDAPEGGLSAKERELITTAIEVAAKKTNPPPEGHARKAMEAGATVQELAEAISICVLLAGMVTYRESGRFALRAAVEWAQQHGGSAAAPRKAP